MPGASPCGVAMLLSGVVPSMPTASDPSSAQRMTSTGEHKPVWSDCNTTVELYRTGGETCAGMALLGKLGHPALADLILPTPPGLVGSTR